VRTALTAEPGWTPSTSPIAAFGRMTEAAVSDGYAGLRVLTDATEIVRDEGTRPWWVRGEHVIDRYGLDHPLTIVCGYDVDLVGEEVLAEMACLHALTGEAPCPFLLRARPDGLALVGEVDRTSAVRLYHAVLGIGADLPRPIVLDLSEHEFIDHSALVALQRAAHALGTRIELVGASPLTACLVDALELTGVVVREVP
jgi:anti-anti-sigma regulatory factor